MHFTTTIGLAGLAIHHASATFGHHGWDTTSQYSTPDNTDNKCSDNQKTGYNWADLSTGSFDSYGGNKFSNWSCTNSFGKRDLLSRRSFQDKCISSNLDDHPSIGCNGDDAMSIDKYQVSSSEDADIECHYEMPDKSVCKEYHSCKAGGIEIQNSQCGGAKSVTFKPAESYKGKGCSIGVHSIEFNCGSASSNVPEYSSTSTSISTAAASTPVAYSTTSSVAPVETSSCVRGYGSSCSAESSPVSSSKYSSPVSSLSTTSEGAPSYPSSSETKPVESVPTYGSSENSPATAPVYSSSAVHNSSIAYSIPAYPSSSSVGSSTTIPSTPSATIGVTSSSTAAATTPSSPPNYPPPSSPDLLPRCLNTWLHTVSCKDNTDYSCFCKNINFITKVYGCLSSWSQSADNTTNGVSYLVGLCAPYIPSNPAIITGCPSSVMPAVYTPPALPPPPSEASPVTTQPATQPAPPPCTTITYSSEVVIHATDSASASAITTTILTTITVPKVILTTYTVTESGSTVTVPDLGYGTPPPVSPTVSSEQAPLLTDTHSAPAPPYVTSTSTLIIPGVGSSLKTETSAKATGTAPVAYQGSGVRAREVAGVMVVIIVGGLGWAIVL
ncbi:unnamed protein product [Zymoseptoria tritici ST99CH_3D1]|nr:unnamed protein product [Zymoseptoria tritici ST99CH_3D1]